DEVLVTTESRYRTVQVDPAPVPGHPGADEDTDVSAAQFVVAVPGVAQAPGARLQHQADRRIEVARLVVGHAEELRVEVLDAVDEATPHADTAARRALRVVQPSGVPTRHRYLGDGTGTRAQQPPERIEVRCTGQPAGHADDRDPLVPRAGRAARYNRCGRRLRCGRHGGHRTGG